MIVKSAKYVSKTIYLTLKYSYSPTFLHSKLKELLSDQPFIFKLSHHTRILPEYFTHQYLKRFKSSKNIDVYADYAKKKGSQPFDQETKDSVKSEIFKLFPNYRKNVFVLDCYLDWLTKTVLKPNTNEYYKNKTTMEAFDMRSPQNWFSNTKGRHFIYHHGPTNSGKTSSAIKELKQLPKDSKGIYMAPLRLLAWEMQQKLQNCNLITGQDKEFRVSNLTSCTIEALNGHENYDVAIIDEIQMIGDPERGWSWTKALLATKAKRIHLCGDQRAIGLVSKLIKQCGGSFEQRRYSRLGKLKLIPRIFQISKIEQGDCMIEFSVQTLHNLRKKIKEELDRRKKQSQSYDELMEEQCLDEEGKRVSKIAMVYGRLPPECRKEQARKFNANIAPYLVATNAIGMGLNLNIKKIIFAGIKRRNFKGQEVELQEHEIQQIAGRAGRGLNDGLVQCASFDILKKVRKALRNVNQTYGINLQVEQSEQLKRFGDDQQPDSTNINKAQQALQQNMQHYDSFLKRILTQKQRRISKAGLFLEYNFLRRMIIFMEESYSKKISIGDSLRMNLNLSLRSQDMYFLSEKPELLEWIDKLEREYKMEQRDVFETAKALSMHYNSPYVRQKMAYYASQFSNKLKAYLPKHSIQTRNARQVHNNFLKLDFLQSNYSVIEVYINLWNKYEFIFWDIEEAKRLKEVTASRIKQVLADQEGFVNGRKGRKANAFSEAEDEQTAQTKLTVLDQTASDIEQIVP